MADLGIVLPVLWFPTTPLSLSRKMIFLVGASVSEA